MPELEVYTRLPEVVLLPQRIPPAVPFYVPPGCFLRVFSYSSYGTTPVDIRLVLMLPDGSMQVQTEAHAPNSDRSIALSDYPLPECFIVGLCASLYSLSVARGRVWVDATVCRGLPGPGAVSLHTLIQGYTSGRDVLKYPEGQWGESTDGRGWIRSITGTNPAAGSEISETVPTGALWWPIALIATLVTSATVADRYASLILDDGTTTYVQMGYGTAHQASNSITYLWAVHTRREAVSNAPKLIPLPDGIFMPAGHRLRTSTFGWQTGDDWGAPQLLVEEWIAP